MQKFVFLLFVMTALLCGNLSIAMPDDEFKKLVKKMCKEVLKRDVELEFGSTLANDGCIVICWVHGELFRKTLHNVPCPMDNFRVSDFSYFIQ